jgi:hypothetical protein
MLVPILAIGLFWITASPRFIGPWYRNRWWENLVMVVVLGVSCWGAYGSIRSVWDELHKPAASATSKQQPSTQSH